MKKLLLAAGDIGFTCGDSKVSKAIRWFTRSKGEPKTLVNHVFIVLKGGTLDESVIIEAVSTVKRGLLVKRYGPPKKDRVAIVRVRGLAMKDLATVCETAEGYEGRRYGHVKIAAHVLDRLLGGRYVFRRIAGMADYPICSWLVAHSFEKAGISFGVPTDAADPDDIWDWVTAHKGKFSVVRPLTPLGGQA